MNPLIFFIFSLVSISIYADPSLAADPCSGKADFEVRLDRPEKSLENCEIVDQDSIGVCYAAADATVLQSVLPNHPDISYLDYSIQYKKAEHQNKSVKIAGKNGGNILDGGYICDYFNSIKKKGVCPREKVGLETLNTSNPDLQVQSIEGIGRFFDLQKNLTPAKREKTKEALKKALRKVTEGGVEECKKFPTAMRAVLAKVYAETEKEISELQSDLRLMHRPKSELQADIQERQKKVDELNAQISSIESQRKALKSEHDETLGKIDRKKDALLRKVFKNRTQKLTQKEIDEFNTKDRELASQLSYPKNKLDLEMIYLKDSQNSLKRLEAVEGRINKARENLKMIGEKVPDSDSKVANATKIMISDGLEKKLQTDYRAIVAKIRPTGYKWDEYIAPAIEFVKSIGIPMTSSIELAIMNSKNLEDDYNQMDAKRCENHYIQKNRNTIRNELKVDLSCSDPNLADPAITMISAIRAQMNENIDSEKLIDKLSENSFDYLEVIIDSSCTEKDRIKIPQTLSCNERNTLARAWDSPGTNSLQSEAVTQMIAKQFNTDSKKSIDQGRAVRLGVCSDLFDYSSADSSYGVACRSGGHAVSMIGYRCKGGKVNYLIQNSWGGYTGYTGEDDHGRAWVPERLLIRNMHGYATYDGSIK